MENLAPHAMCLSADPTIIAILVICNAAIAISYFFIPLAMLRYVTIQPPILLNLFVLFIIGCGMTHVMQVVTMYSGGLPYWMACVACVVPRVVSGCTALLLFVKGPAIVAAQTGLPPQTAQPPIAPRGK